MASPMKSEQRQSFPVAAGQLKDDGSSRAASTSSKKKSASASALSSNDRGDDSKYRCDAKKLADFRTKAPWQKDAKYFKSCSISPSAVMKMMMHCQSGVNKGISKGGNPIEVMGLLMGRPDYESKQGTLVVTDAFPLPIEGFETRVIADDASVVNHMIALGECLERTRKEKFMGWYHSHPFDLGDHSHCFLSQTDLSTQLQWQRAEDPHGNPFVAIVLDPLRSIHKSKPELKAFRAYPPEYNSPIANQCPNGSVQTSEQARLEHWGSCWNRYYELDVEYFMSSTARGILEQLTQDYLWMRKLGGSGNAAEEEKELPGRISKTAQMFKAIDGSSASSSSSSGSNKPMASVFGSSHVGAPLALDSGISRTIAVMASTASMSVSTTAEPSEMDKAVKQVADLASEQIDAETIQFAKEKLFSK